MFLKFGRKLVDFFASLKLGVGIIISLTFALAAATFTESLYDTPTAQYYVYRSFWFHGILGLLAINIAVVALSRWPWKARHIPFLLAHLGIEMVIVGSWVTQNFGLDGNLRLNEGETGSVVEIDHPMLQIADMATAHSLPVPWIPPAAKFKPISVEAAGLPYELTIDKYISRAEPQYSFVADAGSNFPALHLQIQGGPMRITQDLWLWEGHPSWSAIQMGPAWFAIGPTPANEPHHAAMQPGILLMPAKDGSLSWLARLSDGKESQGTIKPEALESSEMHPGWKGDVKLTVLKYIPRAMPLVTYQPSRTQFGAQAPSSAIHLVAGQGGDGAESWLGLGDRAVLKMHGREVQVGYYPQRVILPFGVRLDRFSIDHDPGTNDPAAYSSKVTVVDPAPQGQTLISMNEPLHYRGLTIYQASYENPQPLAGADAPGSPGAGAEDRKQASQGAETPKPGSDNDPMRPTISIFSVNRDPGRQLKYYGSLLIVGGSILLFAMRYRRRKPTPAT